MLQFQRIFEAFVLHVYLGVFFMSSVFNRLKIDRVWFKWFCRHVLQSVFAWKSAVPWQSGHLCTQRTVFCPLPQFTPSQSFTAISPLLVQIKKNNFFKQHIPLSAYLYLILIKSPSPLPSSHSYTWYCPILIPLSCTNMSLHCSSLSCLKVIGTEVYLLDFNWEMKCSVLSILAHIYMYMYM